MCCSQPAARPGDGSREGKQSQAGDWWGTGAIGSLVSLSGSLTRSQQERPIPCQAGSGSGSIRAVSFPGNGIAPC